MNWRGAWSSATAYAVNDGVSSGGSSYICIAANTNNAPPNATYWSLLAQVGATGATGAAGAPGQGVPVGGTTGQVLSKNSATNYDTVWANDVASFNTRTGAVTLTTADVTGAGGAPLASPAFTGTPSLPTGTTGVTQTPTTNSTRLATTAFVQTVVAPAFNDVGRNLIQNPYYAIQQRGTGPWTTTGSYTADRWRIFLAGSTMSVSVNAVNDTQRGSIGDDAATWYLSAAVTGTSGSTDAAIIIQPIEDLHRLGGKTVTVSFWALTNAGQNIGVSIDQYFGTGGTPSGTVLGTGQSQAVAGFFARYSVTLSVATIVGKTLGTNNDHCSLVNFWLTGGSGNNTRSGTVGVQSGTFGIWGVQLEVGSLMSPMEKIDPGLDLMRCMRFYQVGNFQVLAYAGAGVTVANIALFPVPFRAPPAVTPTFPTQSNCGSSAVAAIDGTGAGSPISYRVLTVATALGGINLAGTFTASAEL